jgi:CBS domain-containing protein
MIMNLSTDDRQVQVQLIMTPLPLQTSSLGNTIKGLADQMNEHGRGAIVIVDSKNSPIGIITERDIVRRVVSAGKDPSKTNASDIMSKPVITGDPEMSIYNAALTMTRYNIRRLPIVRDNTIYGIVTASDMAKRLYEKDKRDPTLAAMSRFHLIEK